MTLREQIMDLKYRKGVATCELVRLFPENTSSVSEIALLEIPEKTLRRVVREKHLLQRLLALKKQLPKFKRVDSRNVLDFV